MFRPHAPLAYERNPAVRSVANRLGPPAVLHARHPLDNGNELQELHSVLGEEPVHPARMVAVVAVHDNEGVEVDAVVAEQTQAADHPVVGGLAVLIHAITVVQVGRAINRQPDQKAMLLEECAPTRRRAARRWSAVR